MKKFLGLLILVMVLLCGTSLAAEWENKYPKAPASRLGITVPKGLAITEEYQDGRTNVLVRMADMSREDWKSVMIHGGYPYVRVRPYVKAPAGYDTCISFNGGFHATENDIFDYFVSELRNNGIWENNHTTHSNGEDVGEIVADQCLLLPRSSTGNGGGGFFIAWMDKDKYYSLYPNGHTFTVDELLKNKDKIFYYEYVELIVKVDTTEPFYVPFRSLSAASMEPTRAALQKAISDGSIPNTVKVKSIVNGDITYEFSSLSRTVDVPLVLKAPAGATKLFLFEPGFEDWNNPRNAYDVGADGLAICSRQIHDNSYTDEYQHVAVWLDAQGNIVDFGIFWTHSERTGYLPNACYGRNGVTIEFSDGTKKQVAWHPATVKVENNCAFLGVKADYNSTTGIYHVSYDEVTEVEGTIDSIRVSAKAPTVKDEETGRMITATYARFNSGGGNDIMGYREDLFQESHDIITGRSYIQSGFTDKDGYLELFSQEPLRHYAVGPVDVYIQSEAVWPYGGGHHVIYWYENKAAADSNPEHPLKIEYVVNTADTICVTSRTEIVESEDEIENTPVDNVTCVRPSHNGHGWDGWHLVIHRYPQRGQNACHWELYMENECGDYEPLDGETVFYMPYPNGHSYDTKLGCAVDRAGNEASYDIYHYNSDYTECDSVVAQPTEYGIRFVVNSLSPFVLDWGDFQGDLIPDQGGNGEGGDHGGNGEWMLPQLELWEGNNTIHGVNIRNISVSTHTNTLIEQCQINNLSIEPRSENNHGVYVRDSHVETLGLMLGSDTPTALESPFATIAEDTVVMSARIYIPEPGSEDMSLPGPITRPLVTFEGSDRNLSMLGLEGDWQAFDPIWFGDNVTFEEVFYPGLENPIPYAQFLAELEAMKQN